MAQWGVLAVPPWGPELRPSLTGKAGLPGGALSFWERLVSSSNWRVTEEDSLADCGLQRLGHTRAHL